MFKMVKLLSPSTVVAITPMTLQILLILLPISNWWLITKIQWVSSSTLPSVARHSRQPLPDLPRGAAMPPLSSDSSGGGTLPLSTCHLTPYNLRVPKEPNQCKDSMFAAPLPPGRTLLPMRTEHGTCAFHSQRTMVMPAFMSVSMAQLSENIPTDVPPEALAHWGHRMPPSPLII